MSGDICIRLAGVIRLCAGKGNLLAGDIKQSGGCDVRVAAPVSTLLHSHTNGDCGEGAQPRSQPGLHCKLDPTSLTTKLVV